MSKILSEKEIRSVRVYWRNWEQIAEIIDSHEELRRRLKEAEALLFVEPTIEPIPEDDIRWITAEEHLNEIIQDYKELPNGAGWFGLQTFYAAQRLFAEGDRSTELYEEIMGFE